MTVLSSDRPTTAAQKQSSRTAAPEARQLRVAARITRKGLQLPPHLGYQNWLIVGKQLADATTASAWCLGDWLIYGKEAFSGRYRKAIEETSLEYQTLRNYAWVAGRFSVSRRRDTLSFAHHAEVVSLSEPEQDFWLRKATEFSWSVKQLRREIKASQNERADGEAMTEPGSQEAPEHAATVRLQLSHAQIQLYQRAADSVGLTVQDWAVGILERAAEQVAEAAMPMAQDSDRALQESRKANLPAPAVKARWPDGFSWWSYSLFRVRWGNALSEPVRATN